MGTIVGFFEYPNFDFRLNGFRYSISENNYEKIPYRNNVHFKNNQFELKYTTYDGNDFKSNNNIKSII
jgi:hypothetical protein